MISFKFFFFLLKFLNKFCCCWYIWFVFLVYFPIVILLQKRKHFHIYLFQKHKNLHFLLFHPECEDFFLRFLDIKSVFKKFNQKSTIQKHFFQTGEHNLIYIWCRRIKVRFCVKFMLMKNPKLSNITLLQSN